MVELCTNRYNKCKIINWKEKSKNVADWEKSREETKVRIGLQCLRRRKKNIGFGRKADMDMLNVQCGVFCTFAVEPYMPLPSVDTTPATTELSGPNAGILYR
jgi:hypothetical protein